MKQKNYNQSSTEFSNCKPPILFAIASSRRGLTGAHCHTLYTFPECSSTADPDQWPQHKQPAQCFADLMTVGNSVSWRTHQYTILGTSKKFLLRFHHWSQSGLHPVLLVTSMWANSTSLIQLHLLWRHRCSTVKTNLVNWRQWCETQLLWNFVKEW
jgi:hypothetical protein